MHSASDEHQFGLRLALETKHFGLFVGCQFDSSLKGTRVLEFDLGELINGPEDDIPLATRCCLHLRGRTRIRVSSTRIAGVHRTTKVHSAIIRPTRVGLGGVYNA